jgi:hypothetical protein
MMVLVDSCVWSLSFRRRKDEALDPGDQQLRNLLQDLIAHGNVAMIGPIRQEVLSGIREIDQFQKLKARLASIKDVDLTTPHYEEAARLYNLCRSRGMECGPIDILLCAVAVERNWPILTYDNGLKRSIQALRPEGLLEYTGPR